MVEDDTWDKIIGIGIVLGFLFLIYQASKQSQPKTAEHNQSVNQIQNPLAGWRPLSKIPSIDALSEFQPMPVHINPVLPINRQAPVPPVDRQIPVPPPMPASPACAARLASSPIALSSAPTTTYKNNERWVIRRGDDGRIIDMNIIRDAKVNEL